MDFTSETGIRVALAIRSVAAWLVALILFVPILFMLVTSFKTELQAIAVPSIWVFAPTLDNYAHVQERSDYLLYAENSFITSVVSTIVGLLIAAPAAYSMAFFPSKRTKGILMWMLSTKMMPAVGALVPVYVLCQSAHLLDTRFALVVVFMLSNLPLMVWMLYSHFKDIPPEILEAARMDGASLAKEIVYVLAPMAVPGIASTLLLNIILAWNEAFWTLNLTAANAAPLTAFIAS